MNYETFKGGIGITTLASDRGAIDNIQEDSPIKISGVALPENQIVKGGKGVEHFYGPEKAEEAAQALQDQIEDDIVHLVKSFHDLEGQANADQVIGEITSAGYSPGVGVVFEGETVDEETAQKINNGYLDVSPSVARSLGEFDETMQARGVDRVTGFRDIAVVARGQPGADVEIGSNPAVEALSRSLDIEMDTLQDTKSVAGVSFQGTREGKLDESEIDENFGDHALYGDGENKEDYSYWVVDADGYLRKGNLESAWSLGCRGQCPGTDEHRSNLMDLADEFEDPPEFAQEETETMSLDDAKETIADEYDIDVETLDERLSESDSGGEDLDENVVKLVES